MALEDHLAQGEQIISRCHPFYATSRRIIRYRRDRRGERVECLPYARLSVVEVVHKPSHKVMAAGTLTAVLGVFLAAMGLVTSILALVAGTALVVYGGMGRPGYYQLRTHGMTRAQEEPWRIDYRASGGFIATIRTVIGEREGP